MTASFDYAPPKVWTWNKPNGGRFANVNRPIAGSTHDKDLPVGHHPLQLYSQGTPNGVKVTVMLEELLALGTWRRRIRRLADQNRPGRSVREWLRCAEPQLQDPGAGGPKRPDAYSGIRVRGHLDIPRREVRRLPADRKSCARRMPLVAVLAGGQRAICWRGLRPLLRLRADQDRICHRSVRHGGETSTRRARPATRSERISSLAATTPSPISPVWPWYAGLTKGWLYQAAEFLQAQEYRNVGRWVDAIGERPAVQRGRMVNRVSGEPSSQLHERHDASDFETKTQEKLTTAS